MRNARIGISRDNSFLGAIKSYRVMWRAKLLIMHVIMIIIIIERERERESLHAMVTFVNWLSEKFIYYEKNKYTYPFTKLEQINYKIILKNYFENILKINRLREKRMN